MRRYGFKGEGMKKFCYSTLAGLLLSVSCSSDQTLDLRSETRRSTMGSAGADNDVDESSTEDEDKIAPPVPVAGAFLISCEQTSVITVYNVSCLIHNEKGEKHRVVESAVESIQFNTSASDNKIAPPKIHWHEPDERMHFSFLSDMDLGEVENVYMETDGGDQIQTESEVKHTEVSVQDNESNQDQNQGEQGEVNTGIEGRIGPTSKKSESEHQAKPVFFETFDGYGELNPRGYKYVDTSEWDISWANNTCDIKEPKLEVRTFGGLDRHAELYPDCFNEKDLAYLKNASLKLKKTLSVTPNQTYKVSFKYKRRHSDSGIKFKLNNGSYLEKSGDEIDCNEEQQWCDFSMEHTANEEGSLTMEFIDLTRANRLQQGVLLDDVLVVELVAPQQER